MIRLESVRKVYGAGPGRTVALEGVSLVVPAGHFVAVAGPSGSGKTTLLNLIGGLDEPTSGSVSIDGHNLGDLSEDARDDLRLRSIGFVFQNFNLVPVLSAAENVELPLLFRRIGATERRRRVARALERVGLAGKRQRRPADLSGGEAQRVAVARALAGEPALVLADEPTANLDHETGRAVIGLMHELNRESRTTFLYASHDPELIRLADRVIDLRDGRILEQQA
jgi:putative ABC transport system ATP-binding protein